MGDSTIFVEKVLVNAAYFDKCVAALHELESIKKHGHTKEKEEVESKNLVTEELTGEGFSGDGHIQKHPETSEPENLVPQHHADPPPAYKNVTAVEQLQVEPEVETPSVAEPVASTSRAEPVAVPVHQRVENAKKFKPTTGAPWCFLGLDDL